MDTDMHSTHNAGHRMDLCPHWLACCFSFVFLISHRFVPLLAIVEASPIINKIYGNYHDFVICFNYNFYWKLNNKPYGLVGTLCLC